ncbi:hypothetical protein E3O50_07430, partial [Cryobacterium sp. MDB1-18-1]
MPDQSGSGEEGIDWLASQLGDGTKPTLPDDFVMRRPRRAKGAPADAPGRVSRSGDASGAGTTSDPETPAPAFLWGLKPTTATAAVTVVKPAASAPVAPPVAPPLAPTPAVHSPVPVGEPSVVEPAVFRPRAAGATSFPARAGLTPAPITPPAPAASTTGSPAGIEPSSGSVPAGPAAAGASASAGSAASAGYVPGDIFYPSARPLATTGGAAATPNPGPTEGSPVVGADRGIRPDAPLEPWWTTPARSPLVLTPEEVAADRAATADGRGTLYPARNLPAPEPIPEPLPVVPAPSHFRLRGRRAAAQAPVITPPAGASAAAGAAAAAARAAAA